MAAILKKAVILAKNWLAPYLILISTQNSTFLPNLFFAQNAQLFHEKAGLIRDISHSRITTYNLNVYAEYTRSLIISYS